MRKILGSIFLFTMISTQSQNHLVVNRTKIGGDCGNCGVVVLSTSTSSITSTNNVSLPINNITLELEFELEACSGGGSTGGVETVLNTRINNVFQSVNYTGSGSQNTCNSIEFGAVVIKDLIQTSTPLCEEEKLFTGNLQVISGLRWQYFNSSNQWVDIPNSNNIFPLNKSIQEALGANYESLFTGTFQLRYQLQRVNVLATSNIVNFTIIGCSPQLLDYEPVETTCSYSDDGSFRMILDRQIPTGQKLVASLFFENAFVPGDYGLVTQKDTTTLINNGNGTYTYNWPSDTPIVPGRYKVRYQTVDTTTPNPVWNSLEGTETAFIVGSPPAVTFSGTKLNDAYCKDGSDGAIRLNASGGVGGYQYQVNGGNWENFSSGGTHTINTFPKGTYNIKVQDANGCTERN